MSQVGKCLYQDYTIYFARYDHISKETKIDYKKGGGKNSI